MGNAPREIACLRALGGHLEVPGLLESDPSIPMIVTAAVAGRHGQELVDEGHGRQVLSPPGAPPLHAAQCTFAP